MKKPYKYPRNEVDRLVALRRFNIIESPSDVILDGITQGVADLCETPTALISEVGSRYQKFKGSVGVSAHVTSRELAFCSHAILRPTELMEVEDASRDKRFYASPLVTGESKIRFYAGMPLVTSDGYAVGALCVLDNKPHRLSATQRHGVKRFAQVVVDLLEERYRGGVKTIDHVDRSILTDAIAQGDRARASQSRLAHIVEESVNEIYVANAETHIILDINKAARENLGYSLEESLQLGPWDFVEGINRDNINELVSPLKEGALDVQMMVTVHRRKDGSTYPVSSHIQMIRSQTPPVFVAIVQDITESQEQQESIHLRDRAIEALDVGVAITDTTKVNAPLVYVNKVMCEISGYEPDELLGQGVQMMQLGQPNQPAQIKMEEARRNGEPVQVILKNTRKDGSHYMAEVSISPVHNSFGDLTHYVGITRDITERLYTEERLRQTEKIDAIGQLSGGIAHDFNNLLSVIITNIECLSLTTTDQSKLDCLNEADSAARMGARLTQRLQGFAKQGQFEPVVLNVNDPVLNAIEMLLSTIGESINLSHTLSPDLWNILADRSEIENAVVNLAINARDAMPDGGTVKVQTRNISFTSDDANTDSGVSAGDYIELSVSDSGIGMTDEVKARMLEPFYTTKAPGKGTGLGLATIHWFTTQCGGYIIADSEPGCGTTIKLYLPKFTV